MRKPKQQHKTSEELLADLKKNAEFIAKMKFAKEVFYPALCAASDNIDDATFLLGTFNNMVVESFLDKMKEFKVKEMTLRGTPLIDKLDKASPKYAENLALFNLFADMTVFDAKDHIEGMKGEIEKFKLDEFRSRPLSSLPTKWLDELK